VQYLPQIDLALFGVAGNGTLVAQTGKGAARSQLTWFGRSGKQVGAVGPPGVLPNPSISPDGRRVAFDQAEGGGRRIGIWIHELADEAVTRFTFDPSLNQTPVWSPDGKRIVFVSNRATFNRLYQKNADGTGSEKEISNFGEPRRGQRTCWNWSRDGKYLLAGKDGELWYVSLPDRQLKPFLQAKWIFRNAQFSPDGKWVAYSSNELGNWEVYVSPFPSADGKWQVSRNGGEEPRWRQDGKELFYLSGDGKMMTVAVKAGARFEAGPPSALFQTHMRQRISSPDVFSYDVTADGQKFLINTRMDETNAAPLSIILHWASEMEK
jgi:Tol biopolymer transport system component